MNRLGIILAVVVWAIVIGIVGYSYFGPKEDPRVLVKQLITVMQDYVDGRDVNASGITKDGVDYDFARAVANHYRERQIIERELNTETKQLMATLSVNSISNPLAIDSSLERASKYQELVETKRVEFKKSVDKMVESARAMRGETEIFDVDLTIKDSIAIGESHEAQAKVRVVLGQYVKALLDFVKSRTGYYTVEETGLVFKTPEDQAYFDQVMKQTKDIDGKLSDMVAAERSQLRAELGKVEL